jgi:hypothetical protein
VSTLKVDTYLTRGGASEIAIDKLKGVTAAGSMLVVGEGGTNTTNLQQGLAKAWTIFGNDAVADDSFNIASATDVATGKWRHVKTSVMANTTYSVVGSTGFEIGNFVPGFTHTTVETTANHALSKYLKTGGDFADMNASGTAKEIVVGDLA